jgi:integrase
MFLFCPLDSSGFNLRIIAGKRSIFVQHLFQSNGPESSFYLESRGACKKMGIARITHHDLRHLFSTRCNESGVDIPSVTGSATKMAAHWQ